MNEAKKQVKVNSILEKAALSGIKGIESSAEAEQLVALTIGSLWNEAIESVRTSGKPLDSKGYDRKAVGKYGLTLFADTHLVRPAKDGKPKLNSVYLSDCRFMLLNWADIHAYLVAADKLHLRNPSRSIRAFRDSTKVEKSDTQKDIDRANNALKAITVLCDKEQEKGIDRAAKLLLAQAYAALKVRFENDGGILDNAVETLLKEQHDNKAA